LVWQEDFSNGMSTTAVPLYDTAAGATPYVGASSENYTADSMWLPTYSACNGWVMNSTMVTSTAATPPAGQTPAYVNAVDHGCNVAGGRDPVADNTVTPAIAAGASNSAWWWLGQMGIALGNAEKAAGVNVDPTTNYVVAAETNHATAGSTTADGNQPTGVQFKADLSTANPAVAPIPGHYYVATVWVAAVHCNPGGSSSWSDPQQKLTLTVDGTTNDAQNIDICQQVTTPSYNTTTATGNAHGTDIYTYQAVTAPVQALTNTAFALTLENLTQPAVATSGAGSGNDTAFDLPQIWDVTPQVDKKFSTAKIDPGQPATLTFTVTNTLSPDGKNAAKPNWSFTDTLPDNMTIADTDNLTNTCGPIPAVTVGAKSVTATGSLADGATVCTITVDVTATATGSYVNGPDTTSVDNTNGDFGDPIKDTKGNTVSYSNLSGLWAPLDATLDVVGPALSILKTPDPKVVTSLDEPVKYTFDVTNSGDAPAYNVSVTDLFDTANGGGDGTMTPIVCTDGTTTVTMPDLITEVDVDVPWTCTATYTSTANDQTAKEIDNTATVTGTSTEDGDPTAPDLSATADAKVPVAALELTKSADPAVLTAAGDVAYTFTVKNTGSVPINDVTVTDPGPTGGTGTMSDITCDPTTLANNGDTATCQATYTATADDVAAGVSLVNTATASGTTPSDPTDPNSTPVAVTSNEANATVYVASLSLVKKADPAVISAADDVVNYTFTVKNTGTVAISGVAINDSGNGGAGTMSAITCPTDPLPVGESEDCTATYTAVQADIDANKALVNTATAAGTATDPNDPAATPVDVTSNEDTATVDIASLSLAKVADTAVLTAPGDVNYTFTVTNTGTATIYNVSVADPGPAGGQGTMSEVTCPTDPLPAGDSVDCTATYTATAEDLADGQALTNTATAAGDTTSDPADPANVPVASQPATATVDVASLSLVKTGVANLADPKMAAPGDTVDFTFVATNTGSVTLHDVGVTDDAMPDLVITCPSSDTSWPEATAGDLNVGDSVTCEAPYTLLESDVTAGVVNNGMVDQNGNVTTVGATVTGTTGDGTEVHATAAVQVPLPQEPILALQKSANPTAMPALGGAVTYTFKVTNTGTGPAYDIAINDNMLGNAGVAVTCPKGELAVGQTVSCTATYKVQPADLARGVINNTATATGWTAPGCTTASADCITVVSPPAKAQVVGAPALSLVKLVDKTTVVAGDTATYTYVVTNTGTAPANNLTIWEKSFSGSGTASPITCNVTTLLPGQVTACTNTYVMTAADVLAGVPLTNTADALCTAPGSTAWVSSNDSSASIAPPGPAGPAAVTGGSVNGALALWPMMALMVTGGAVWLVGWRRKLAA